MINDEIEMSSIKGKNIVITGGLGFIGSNLAYSCVKNGSNVTIVDNLDPEAGGNTFNIQPFESDIKVISGDICDSNLMQKLLKTSDIVINCAAQISHTQSLQTPFRNLEVNCTAVLGMLEIIKNINPKIQFIQIGSTTQIGKSHSSHVDESHQEFPLDPYSAHKTLAEKYTYMYSQVHRLKTNVIRLPNIYGPRAAINSQFLTFNNYFIGLALQNKDITIYGDGRQYRNLLYVDDAVEAILNITEKSDGSGEVYLAVHDDHVTVAEVAEKIVTVFGKGAVRYISWPEGRKNIEIGDAIYTNKKIKKDIGWFPKTSFIDGLTKTKDYYYGCLEKYL